VSILGSIASLATGSYTRTRYAAGTTTDGVYTPGSTSTASIVASVQPVRGEELHALPEGRHADQSRVVYSESELRAAPIPDRVTIDGAEFEVFKAERWDAFGETYYRALASRLVVP
jgi:hypothetical protein